jgi:hypothetical protein
MRAAKLMTSPKSLILEVKMYTVEIRYQIGDGVELTVAEQDAVVAALIGEGLPAVAGRSGTTRYLIYHLPEVPPQDTIRQLAQIGSVTIQEVAMAKALGKSLRIDGAGGAAYPGAKRVRNRDGEEYPSIEEASRRLGIHRATVKEMIKRNELMWA